MTINHHQMSETEQGDFFTAIDRINRAGNALKIIVWALVGLTTAGLAVAWWVWNVNAGQAEIRKDQTSHKETLDKLEPRLQTLETRAVRFDAAPPPSQAQFHEIDKRLDRHEIQLLDIREQTALILEAVKKLESRP